MVYITWCTVHQFWPSHCSKIVVKANHPSYAVRPSRSGDPLLDFLKILMCIMDFLEFYGFFYLEHNKPFFAQRANKATSEDKSSPKELEVGPRSGPCLLVCMLADLMSAARHMRGKNI